MQFLKIKNVLGLGLFFSTLFFVISACDDVKDPADNSTCTDDNCNVIEDSDSNSTCTDDNCNVIEDSDSNPTCADDIVETEGGCLVDDAYCYQMDDGKWCTGPATPQCPDGYAQLEAGSTCSSEDSSICFMYSESFYCKLVAEYTIEECESAGGQGMPDPGDGSLISSGCKDDAQTLGYIIEYTWDEGGLCCK